MNLIFGWISNWGERVDTLTVIWETVRWFRGLPLSNVGIPRKPFGLVEINHLKPPWNDWKYLTWIIILYGSIVILHGGGGEKKPPIIHDLFTVHHLEKNRLLTLRWYLQFTHKTIKRHWLHWRVLTTCLFTDIALTTRTTAWRDDEVWLGFRIHC